MNCKEVGSVMQLLIGNKITRRYYCFSRFDSNEFYLQVILFLVNIEVALIESRIAKVVLFWQCRDPDWLPIGSTAHLAPALAQNRLDGAD